MKNINIKITGVSSKFNPYVTIDGNKVKYKKNSFGSYEINYQTENETVELAIFKFLELQGKFWFLFALISFILSLIGIFEPFYDKNCVVLDCLYKLNLNEQNNIKLSFNNLITQSRAVEIDCDCDFEKIKNIYYIDKKAKRNWLILLITKILIWIALVLTLIFILKKYI